MLYTVIVELSTLRPSNVPSTIREGLVRMFERFTERARQATVLAHEEARELKHHHIGTEHILLGLLREDHGLAAQVLKSLDISIDRVRTQVVRILGYGEEDPGWQIPFTPRAKKVLELALPEALSLGHNYIGTEHILLGLVRENEGVAARILLEFDVAPEKIRNEVMGIFAGLRRVLSTRSPEPSMDSPDAIYLPRGVRLHSVAAFAETWEAYDRLPWQEKATFDPQTGDRHPHKETRWSTGSITVFPPVGVSRDGEFGVRREKATT